MTAPFRFDVPGQKRPNAAGGFSFDMDPVTDDSYATEMQKTLRGKREYREEMRAKQLAEVEKSLAKPEVTETQRGQLQQLKDFISGPDYGQLPRTGYYPGVEHTGGKAALAGIANSTIELARLGLLPFDKLGVGAAKTWRNDLANVEGDVREGLDVRNTTTEKVGEVAGALANPIALKGYGMVAEGTGALIGTVAKAAKLPAIADAIEAGFSAGPATRIATNVATGLPVNLANAADAEEGQKLKTLAMGVGLDAGAGLLFGARAPKNEVDVPVAAALRDENMHEAAKAAPSAEKIIEDLATTKAQTELIQTRKAFEKLYKSDTATEVAGKYAEEMKGTDKPKWRELSKAERDGMLVEWQTANPIEQWAVKRSAEPAFTAKFKTILEGTASEIKPQIDAPAAPTTEPVPVPQAHVDATAEIVPPEPLKIEPPAETVAVKPSVPQQISTKDAFQMPEELSKSAPRYKTQPIQFESAYDKAAYILASDESKATVSRAAYKFKAALENQNLTVADAVQHGQDIKAFVKANASSGDGAIIVPKQEVRTTPTISPQTIKSVETPEIQLTKLNQKQDAVLAKIQTLEGVYQQQKGTLRGLSEWENPEYKSAAQSYKTLDKQIKTFESAGVVAAKVVRDVAPPVDVSNEITTTKGIRPPDIQPIQLDMGKARKPEQLSSELLPQYIAEARRRADQSIDPNVKAEYERVAEKLILENGRRERGGYISGDLVRRFGTTALGGVAGHIYGVMTTENDDPEARARVWMATLAGAGMGYLGGKALERRFLTPRPATKDFFAGEDVLRKDQARIVNLEDAHSKTSVPFTTQLRRFYAGTIRKTAMFEHVVNELSDNDLPLARNPGKLAAKFGRWIRMSESWLAREGGMAIDGKDGEPLYMHTLLGMDQPLANMAQIQQLVKGDKEGLGKVATALTSLELQAKYGEKISTPFDQNYAMLVVKNAPPEYIEAAKHLRLFNLAQLKVMEMSGRISNATFEKLRGEDWYTPLYRMLESGGRQPLRRISGRRINEPTTFKTREGGSAKLPVINPVDQTIALLPRNLRSWEYSNWLQSSVEMFRGMDPKLGDQFMRLEKSANPEIKEIQRKARELADDWDVSKEEASRMFAFAEDHGNAPGNRGGIVTHWEQGMLASYRVNHDVFEVAKALLPFEQDVVNNFVFHAARQINTTAAKGIVFSPKFLWSQFIVDTLTAGMTTKHGFVPFLDSFRGWAAAARRSPEYLKLLDLGGVESVQGLPYLKPGSAQKLIETETGNAFSQAWKLMKEVHPWEAYKAVARPMAEAARVGEALRALGHGESTLSAVFSGRDLLGNTSMEGSLTAMRALHQITLFTRPGIQATDTLIRAIADNPAKFLMKGLAYLTLPSAALWYANKDDEEINAIRRTRYGKGYWYVRTGDQTIMRVRKPHVVGQIFGSTIEDALDKDPIQAKEILGQVYQDVALDMVPLMGTIPAALWADKQWGTDAPITPESQKNLEPSLQGRDAAAMPWRIISDVTHNVLNPAQVDYVARTVGTTLGLDAVKAVTNAHDYVERGYVPAADEMPLIGQLFSKSSAQHEAVYRFYNRLDEVERVQQTIAYMSRPGNFHNDPQALQKYIQSHQLEIALGDTFTHARQKIAELRRATDDLKKMQTGIVSDDRIRETEKRFRDAIEQQAKLAMQVADKLHESLNR